MKMQFVEEYRTMNRAGWSLPMPWDGEPDKAVWVDAATGLDCMALRNHAGAWCGYVGVKPDHPWHGVEYYACLDGCESDSESCFYHGPESRLRVHGGVTFTGPCDEESGLCHIGSGEPVWWFGFDCAHSCDAVPDVSWRFGRGGGVYRDLGFVIEECESLARQLEVASK